MNKSTKIALLAFIGVGIAYTCYKYDDSKKEKEALAKYKEQLRPEIEAFKYSMDSAQTVNREFLTVDSNEPYSKDSNTYLRKVEEFGKHHSDIIVEKEMINDQREFGVVFRKRIDGDLIEVGKFPMLIN